MRRSDPEVRETALTLTDADRKEPSEDLVACFDGPLDPNASSAWAAEIERRLTKMDAGRASALSMAEAVARMRRAAFGR
jgi:hypothetical protein